MAFSEGLTSKDLSFVTFNCNDLSVALFSLSIFFSVMADELSVTLSDRHMFNKHKVPPLLLNKLKIRTS